MCYSPDEARAVIDAYYQKWYSLERATLTPSHSATPTLGKTLVQCCHKMEKQIQDAKSHLVARFNSSWVLFKLMDAMEKGPSSVKLENNDSDSHDSDDNVSCDYNDEGWAEKDTLPPSHPSATGPSPFAFIDGLVGGGSQKAQQTPP